MSVQSGPAFDSFYKQQVEKLLDGLISSGGPFAATFSNVPGIKNVLMANICQESRFKNVQAGVQGYSYSSSLARAFRGYTPVKNVLESGTPEKRAAVSEAYWAWGLLQCMGANLVRGAGPGGKCAIEQLRPDLAGELCVNAGESISNKILGDSTGIVGLKAGLVIWEGNFKAAKQDSAGRWFRTAGGRTYYFASRAEAAVSAHFGLTPSESFRPYAASVLGVMYTAVTGAVSPVTSSSGTQTSSSAASGPSTNGDPRTASTPGCVTYDEKLSSPAVINYASDGVPPWVTYARKQVGPSSKEYTNGQNPKILAWWKDIGVVQTDDSIPWCAVFISACLENVGVRSTRSAAAITYLNYGQKLTQPVFGSIATLSRPGGNHVGFVVGETSSGDLILLGGNQGDMVKESSFPRSRIIGYSWPSGIPLPSATLAKGSAEKSTKES